MNSSTVIVLGIAGVALALSIMALLKAKQQPEVTQAAIAALGRSVDIVAARVDGLMDPQKGVPFMMEYLSNVKAQLDRMSLVDLVEFRRTLHPELKELYRDAVVDTVLPAVNARIALEWNKIPKKERAQYIEVALDQARRTAAMAKDVSRAPRISGFMPKPVMKTIAPVIKATMAPRIMTKGPAPAKTLPAAKAVAVATRPALRAAPMGTLSSAQW